MARTVLSAGVLSFLCVAAALAAVVPDGGSLSSAAHDIKTKSEKPQNPVLSAAAGVGEAQKNVDAQEKISIEKPKKALPSPGSRRKASSSPLKKPYKGPLKTKAVNGSIICETPECSKAAALIIESMDPSVDPCDDFYMFACGGFIKDNPAPPNSGTFDAASDLLSERLTLILQTPAEASDPPPLFMLRRAYDACLDTDYMDSLGLAPLWNALQGIGGWPMVDPAWEEASYSTEGSLASLRDLHISPMLGMSISPDIFNTSHFMIYVAEGSAGISETVLAHPTLFSEIYDAYRTFMFEAAKQMRDYLGTSVTDEEISADVEELLAFETTLSQLMVDAGAANLTDELDKMTVEQVQAQFDLQTPGQFDLLEYLRLVFLPSSVTINADEVIYLEEGSTYISQWSTLLSQTPTRVLANFMSWMWVLYKGEETTYAMRNLTSNFTEVYAGISLDYSRSAFCQVEINARLGFVLSRAYVDEFFPAGAKEENEQLVADIRASFGELLENNTWLTPADLITAEEKLEAVRDFVAYPDWIVDDATFTAAYEGLEIYDNDAFGNFIRIGQYSELYECETYRDEPQPKFALPPTVVNAFYSPTSNSITILAGILQIPFYQHNSLAALNYGGIGMVIGHELTHGFDNTGRNFDKDGNLALWWSIESIQAFNERAQCFVDQYDAFHPPEVTDPTVTVDGQETLGENIADNGGIREAYLAYQLYVSRNGEEPALPGLDEFTSDQLFYLGNANLWCESRTESSIISQLDSDPHSPGRFRILGPLSNDAEFSKVWSCPADSAMNRGDDSCVLW